MLAGHEAWPPRQEWYGACVSADASLIGSTWCRSLLLSDSSAMPGLDGMLRQSTRQRRSLRRLEATADCSSGFFSLSAWRVGDSLACSGAHGQRCAILRSVADGASTKESKAIWRRAGGWRVRLVSVRHDSDVRVWPTIVVARNPALPPGLATRARPMSLPRHPRPGWWLRPVGVGASMSACHAHDV